MRYNYIYKETDEKPICNKQVRLCDEAMTLIKHLSLLLRNCYLVMTLRYQNPEGICVFKQNFRLRHISAI